jgi:hypothetical protein
MIINIKNLSTSYLEIYNNNLFKVIYAFIIAYYACFDPIYSIALTTLIIISIQELHSRKATHSVMSLLPSINTNTNTNTSITKNNTMIPLIPDLNTNIIPDNISTNKINNPINDSTNDSMNDSTNDSMNDSINSINSININSGKMTARIFDNDELVYELINKHSLQKKPSNDDKLTAEYELCREPAFQTITHNLKNIENNTTDADQNISVQGLQGEILNIQGLPYGYDAKKNL